jgi:uncharacterized membrane-anchored protein
MIRILLFLGLACLVALGAILLADRPGERKGRLRAWCADKTGAMRRSFR